MGFCFEEMSYQETAFSTVSAIFFTAYSALRTVLVDFVKMDLIA
jgi:hypothetical protein